MFIRRCGWHRRYYGHAKLLGVTSWTSWTLTFSDGMCDRCAVRAREEWALPPLVAGPATAERGWAAFPFATATVAAALAVVVIGLVARPVRDTVIADRSVANVDQAPADTPAVPPAERRASKAPAVNDASRPHAMTPQSPEITTSQERPRVALQPVPRRGRVVRAGDRRVTVATMAPGEFDQVVQTSVDASDTPHLYAAAPSAMATSPIDARSIHPFSAPRLMENQAP